MRAADAMIVWTPNRDPWLGSPEAGRIVVTSLPAPESLVVHPMSVGACDQNWQEADTMERLRLMQHYVSKMVNRDNMDEQTVLNALAEIDEFRGHHFSTEVITSGAED